jgi:hypothetical protein
MPKYQAHARIKIDVNASFESLRRAELNPVKMGGRPSSGSEPGEAQIRVRFGFGDLTVPASVLISKSLVQISSPFLEQIFSIVDILQRHLIFERGQPSLLASLCSINEPQAVVYDVKKQLVDSELKNMELEARFEKLTDIFLTLDQDLSSLDAKTKVKIRPILKRALDNYMKDVSSHDTTKARNV